MVNPSTERVGILLTNGFIDKEKLAEAAAELNASGVHVKLNPKREFAPVNSIGMERVIAAHIALRHGIVDRIVVLGGMPDDMGVPVEDSHAERLRFYARSENPALDLSDRVEVLPRETETLETKTDLEIALQELKKRGLDQSIYIISDQAHLVPRTGLIKRLLGYPQAKLLLTEAMHKLAAKKVQERTGIKIPVHSEYGGLKTLLTYELPATLLQALDLIPGANNLGTRIIQEKAHKARTYKNKR